MFLDNLKIKMCNIHIMCHVQSVMFVMVFGGTQFRSKRGF